MYIERNDKWIAKADEVFKVQKIRREMEKMEDELMGQLKELSDNTSSRGGHYKFTAIERKGTVDYKAIPELRRVNLELYRKESTISWKLEMDLPTEIQ